MQRAVSRTLPIIYPAGVEQQTGAVSDANPTFLSEEPTDVR